MLKIGDQLPKFSFQGTDGLAASNHDYLGLWVLMYFYPKDATSGCTLEGQDFKKYHAQFKAANAIILGVSRDSIRSHEAFKTKECFPFELISDDEEKLCQAFDVIKEKSMYGKKYQGIERSTFLINPKGVLAAEWRNVKVPGHVELVLKTLESVVDE